MQSTLKEEEEDFQSSPQEEMKKHGSASGGGDVPLRKGWNKAIKTWTRLALVVPILTLIMFVLGSNRVPDASFADIKLEGVGVQGIASNLYNASDRQTLFVTRVVSSQFHNSPALNGI